MTRDGRSGVFLVGADGESVAWRSLEVGIREGRRVQVLADLPAGRVVTLGQQQLNDGSAIRVAAEPAPAEGAAAGGGRAAP